MMELMSEPWFSVMSMPYEFFVDTLKWKVELEEEKQKKMKENTKRNNSRYPRFLRKR